MKPLLFLLPLLLLAGCDKKTESADTKPVAPAPQTPAHPATAAEKVKQITLRFNAEMARVKREFENKIAAAKDKGDTKALNDSKYQKLKEMGEAMKRELEAATK